MCVSSVHTHFLAFKILNRKCVCVWVAFDLQCRASDDRLDFVNQKKMDGPIKFGEREISTEQ